MHAAGLGYGVVKWIGEIDGVKHTCAGLEMVYFNTNRICRTPICIDSMINRMFRNTFPMRDYCIIHLSLGDQG